MMKKNTFLKILIFQIQHTGNIRIIFLAPAGTAAEMNNVDCIWVTPLDE